MRVETIPTNENCRVYWSRVELSDKIEHADRGCSKPKSAILQLLLAIPGVQSVFGNGYQVYVSRSHAYEWEEIEPKIREIIEGAEAYLST